MIFKSLRARARVAGLTWALILELAAANVAANTSAREQAKTLIESGDAAAAYELLAATPGPVGDAEYDYLYGLAALDAGHPGIAVFAFERALATDPHHLYARAELGRALFRLGETRNALLVFREVRAQNPPPAVLERVQQYEAALAPAERRGYALSGFLEAFFGYDSNYNSATSSEQIALPAFGGVVFTLDDLFTEDASATGGLRGDGLLLAPLGAASTFFAGLGFEGAGYTEAEDGYFFINLNGRIGVHHRLDDNDELVVAANGFNTWVGDLDYLISIGITGSLHHAWTDADSTELFVRIATLEYDEAIEYRDVRQYLAGANYVRGQPQAWRYGIGVFGGLEDEQDDDRPDVGRELYGGRVFAEYALSKRILLAGNVTLQFSDYRGIDNLFQRVRDDELVRATLSAQYRFNPRWSVRPELRYTNNDSNIRTNDYERVEALVFLRRQFD